MTDTLTLEDLDQQVRPKVYTQDYSQETLIDGVKLIPLTIYPSEEGDFIELMKLQEGALVQIPQFKIAQINRSNQFAGSIKAWHLHFKQDEVWYVPPQSQLLAGLWDVRKGSKTQGLTNRLVMGGSTNRLLYIPRGVAHGSVNFLNRTGIILYFVNSYFDPDRRDEQRIPWDALGADFWKPQRD